MVPCCWLWCLLPSMGQERRTETLGTFRSGVVERTSRKRCNGRIGPSPAVCLVVNAHILPDTEVSTVVLLGRDGGPPFPDKDVRETETVVTFLQDEGAPTAHQPSG